MIGLTISQIYLYLGEFQLLFLNVNEPEDFQLKLTKQCHAHEDHYEIYIISS